MMSTLDQRNGFKNKCLPINGARPTPLRINANSNAIHKNRRPSKKPSGPVIIYAVSPKVIHTRPQDFMALVQSLTGLNPSRSGSTAEIIDLKGSPISAIDQGYDYDDGGSTSTGSDDQKITDRVISSTKEESFGSKNNLGCFLVSPTMFMPPSKASIGDIPLYTPTGRDWEF